MYGILHNYTPAIGGPSHPHPVQIIMPNLNEDPSIHENSNAHTEDPSPQGVAE